MSIWPLQSAVSNDGNENLLRRCNIVVDASRIVIDKMLVKDQKQKIIIKKQEESIKTTSIKLQEKEQEIKDLESAGQWKWVFLSGGIVLGIIINPLLGLLLL